MSTRDASTHSKDSLSGQTSDAGRLIEVRQCRSAIGSKPKHRSTLQALGLGKVGARRLLPDRPEIRGMIAKVSHLVTVKYD